MYVLSKNYIQQHRTYYIIISTEVLETHSMSEVKLATVQK